MSDPSTTERLDTMEIGYYDADDVVWLITEFRRLREIAAEALVATINADKYTRRLEPLVEILAEHGVMYPFDDLHHAPRCPANNWCRMLPPRGRCNCGAARHARHQLAAQRKGETGER